MLVFIAYVPLDRRCAMTDELANPVYRLHQSGALDLRIPPASVAGALALYGEADWAGYAGEVAAIRRLAIRRDGTIVVAIDGVSREIAPGARWLHYTDRADCGGGWMDDSSQTLVNHGLIDREALRFPTAEQIAP
jgi:hypothetical protein